jgi:hypothetical protein
MDSIMGQCWLAVNALMWVENGHEEEAELFSGHVRARAGSARGTPRTGGEGEKEKGR